MKNIMLLQITAVKVRNTVTLMRGILHKYCSTYLSCNTTLMSECTYKYCIITGTQ